MDLDFSILGRKTKFNDFFKMKLLNQITRYSYERFRY